jgi:cytochrome c553
MGSIALLVGAFVATAAMPPCAVAEAPGAGAALSANDVAPVPAIALVAVCATCHRPDADAIPVIHGKPAAQLAQALRDFPDAPDATVMHLLAMGLSAAEIEAVAGALAGAEPAAAPASTPAP